MCIRTSLHSLRLSFLPLGSGLTFEFVHSDLPAVIINIIQKILSAKQLRESIRVMIQQVRIITLSRTLLRP